MSFFEAGTTPCKQGKGVVALKIVPKIADLGDFSVRRALPAVERRMVGPFVFFDHMGPADFPPGKGIAVRPHPHIGIATITYLFEGQIIHRDSLGIEQPITTGAVNLMVAGKGIVHSERAGPDLNEWSKLHGIQSWIALPTDQEEIEPSFTHYAADDLPLIEQEGATVRVIMGQALGQRSPVKSHSETLYIDVQLNSGATLSLPNTAPELAIYVVEGAVVVGTETLESGVMAVVCPGEAICIASDTPSRLMILGGASIGPREMFWNFVSSSRARIEQAKSDWQAQRFAKVPNDDEFIPLPEKRRS